MGITASAIGLSDIGMKRQNNQDSFLINEKLGLFAVADGMGGHSGGEVASALSVKAMEHVFKEKRNKMDIVDTLRLGVEKGNEIIFEQAAQQPELSGMGTTLTAMAYTEGHVYIAQVGDSRCYFFYEGQLYQVTEDHSQIYELMKLGFVTEANIHHFQKNVITRSVGYEPSVSPDIFAMDVKKGCRFLLCSDGLTGMATNPQIAQILANFDLENSAKNLIRLANLQGGEDNITALIVEFS
ncbi:MAG: Stp1/IreP family PP2C-type Ser/Thr phosphatase [Bdellovibrionota bacterium]